MHLILPFALAQPAKKVPRRESSVEDVQLLRVAWLAQMEERYTVSRARRKMGKERVRWDRAKMRCGRLRMSEKMASLSSQRPGWPPR